MGPRALPQGPDLARGRPPPRARRDARAALPGSKVPRAAATAGGCGGGELFGGGGGSTTRGARRRLAARRPRTREPRSRPVGGGWCRASPATPRWAGWAVRFALSRRAPLAHRRLVWAVGLVFSRRAPLAHRRLPAGPGAGGVVASWSQRPKQVGWCGWLGGLVALTSPPQHSPTAPNPALPYNWYQLYVSLLPYVSRASTTPCGRGCCSTTTTAPTAAPRRPEAAAPPTATRARRPCSRATPTWLRCVRPFARARKRPRARRPGRPARKRRRRVPAFRTTHPR